MTPGRRAAAVGALAGLLLAGLLLGGCSLLGLYGPPLGPPSDTAGAPTTFTIYNASGARLGTIVPQAGTVGRGR